RVVLADPTGVVGDGERDQCRLRTHLEPTTVEGGWAAVVGDAALSGIDPGDPVEPKRAPGGPVPAPRLEVDVAAAHAQPVRFDHRTGGFGPGQPVIAELDGVPVRDRRGQL